MLMVACTACGSAAQVERAGPRSSADKHGTAIALQLASGARHTVDHAGQLRLVRVLSDSRCPPDVQCVWAGDAAVLFEWTPTAGRAQPFELHTGLEPRTRVLDGCRFTLHALSRGPEPVATVHAQPIAHAD